MRDYYCCENPESKGRDGQRDISLKFIYRWVGNFPEKEAESLLSKHAGEYTMSGKIKGEDLFHVYKMELITK